MKKYLILLPIAILIIAALYYRYDVEEIRKALLSEKIATTTNAVDTLAAAVEATPDRAAHDHELNIRAATEFLDKLYQIYSAVYKPVDGNLVLYSEQTYETSVFDPLEYPEFLAAVDAHDYGSLIIGYTPAGQSYRELYLYYRWMPSYAEERYLVVTGISQYSIVTQIPLLVSAGQWSSMAVTLILNIWLVILIVRQREDQRRRE
jgi:hypothetical protein